MTTIVRSQQGDTLDRLCWRHYGRTAGITEQVLEANPGLAHLGPLLPTGHPISLPDVMTAASAPERATVNLWD
ncbi:tail protein X [Pseudomonas mangiferae]|uniref:Phage tail protein n=1 Tax=Pseudomonas mangiferae TaxID=2593654 RepID=A0A553H0I9_9PSED|nr:tail protein X [Pseudomonas mangiferae]TRX75268.1 phage tail protein [Pseudomonas mangiferae]